MRRFCSTLFLLCTCCSLHSQGNIIFSLRVVDNESNPIENLNLTALETSTLRTVESLTDHNGFSVLTLDNGKEWVFSIGEMEREFYLTSVPFSVTEIGEVFVYDLNAYRRKKEQDLNRTEKGYSIFEQFVGADSSFEPPNCMLIIKLKHPKGSALEGISVNVVNSIDSIIYKDKTNHAGEAYFILPNKSRYDIDINDFKNYTYSDFGDEYVKRPFEIEFAPTVVNEKIINDTIYQSVLISDEPSSDRALLKINVRGGKRNGNGETVHLRELNSGTVFSTKANSDGLAYFLVPIKHIYMVDFAYQKNVDAINLLNAKEMTRGEYSIFYSPDPRLEYPELFIPSSENLLVKSFNSFLSKQFDKPKEKPFSLRITSANHINENSKEALFYLTLSSSADYGASIRLPLNVAFVLDKSGSMYCCERAESLKKSLWDIGNSLIEGDVVSTVFFDSEAISVKHIYENYMKELEVVIENYSPAGGTDIYKGLQVGVENVLVDFDENISNRIILLTDGYGVTPPKVITDFIEKKSAQGIEFSSIGLGKDFNHALLELIAIKGNGTFNYVDNSSELSDIFLEEVKAAFNYVVKDLKVEIYFDKNLVFSNLYGYPVTEKSKDMISFNIGKLPKDIDRVAYLKFKLDNPGREIESKPLLVKISYFDLVLNTDVSYQEKIFLEWTDETDTELLLNQEEKKLYAIAILNQSLKVMAEANEQSDRKAAREALLDGIAQIEQIFPEAKPKDVKALFTEVKNYLKLFDQMAKNGG